MSPRGQDTPSDGQTERSAETAAEQEALRLEGSTLEPEEMAALTAVLAHVRAQQGAVAEKTRQTRSGRPDRTLRRRGDLGLWARPGADQWRRGVGPS